MLIEGFLIPARDVADTALLKDYARVRSLAHHVWSASAFGNRIVFPDCKPGDWQVALFLERRFLWRSHGSLAILGGERLTIELEAAAEYGSVAYDYARKRNA